MIEAVPTPRIAASDVSPAAAGEPKVISRHDGGDADRLGRASRRGLARQRISAGLDGETRVAGRLTDGILQRLLADAGEVGCGSL
ncbi:hypothetical protein [Streptomyces sp. NPDC005181]|uniref:hypothetical protein n=1 Tax=Streptomyces sp. NPDC005181 TaxID=3156869 RepID=UPI0033BB6E9E